MMKIQTPIRKPAAKATAANAAVQAALAEELRAQGCTSMRLRQLTRVVAHHYDLEMAAAGLKTTQYSLLSHVLKLGPVRPGDLAKSMKLTASTLTRNAKPLIDAGWLALGAGSDARSRLLTLTPEGKAKRDEGRLRWKLAQKKVNELLGVSRVLALHRLINESLDLLAGNDFLETDD